MGVILREKTLSKGLISFYLDITHNGNRWREFLKIRVNKKRPTPEDQEKRRLAKEIRSKRETELIVEENGLINKNNRKINFVNWLETYSKKKPNNPHYHYAGKHLKKFCANKPLPFQALTPDLFREFAKFMLTKVCSTTARHYMVALNTALKDAVKADLLRKNPLALIDKSERVKRRDCFRQAYTPEQLQVLANTPCRRPQAKLGYLFSCFAGLRWSDVNCLQWSQIIVKSIERQEQYFISFQQEKTEGIEYTPLSDPAVIILKQRAKESQQEETSLFVFPEIRENTSYKGMWRKVTRALKCWAKKAGFDPKLMHFHSGRHTFATNILEHSPEGDLWTVSKLLGHKSIMATQIYAKVRDKRKMAAVKALPMVHLPAAEQITETPVIQMPEKVEVYTHTAA